MTTTQRPAALSFRPSPLMVRILSAFVFIAVVLVALYAAPYAVVASDAGALLVGSGIGRRPLFRSISPRKTVEGAVAGIVAATIVMLVGVSVVLGISPVHGLALGLLVGVSAQMGDLVESQMKR